MTSRHLITRTIAGAAVVAAAATGAACSSNAAADSAYCNEARRWAVHELDAIDTTDAAVFRPYWGEYVEFIDTAARIAPKAIDADWAIYKATVAKQTRVLKKYDFDQAKAEANASDAEKAVYETPGEKSDNAFDEILRYEALTCSAAQPLAAKVDFEGQKADAYCEVIATDSENADALRAASFSVEAVKAAMNGADDTDQAMLKTAPRVIKDDVAAEVKWWSERQRPLVVKYGYDFRKILIDGSNADREVLQLTDKAIRDHYARALAFEQQVCGS